MKLSNKVLIGFFGFIFIYMTAAFTEVRLRGNRAVMDDDKSISETATITGVRYLVLPSLERTIEVIGSNNPRLEVQSMSGEVLQKLKYSVSGDTLTLTELNLDKDQPVKISIHLAKNNFIGMTAQGAWVDIKGIEQKLVSISQTGGSVRMVEKNNIGKLSISASNGATLSLTDTELDTLSVQLDGSELKTDSPVRRLEGSIKNESYLQIIAPKEIQFKKDESSRLNFY